MSPRVRLVAFVLLTLAFLGLAVQAGAHGRWLVAAAWSVCALADIGFAVQAVRGPRALRGGGSVPPGPQGRSPR